MTRNRHPNKEIEQAVRHAESKGWTFRDATGHAWGVLRCPRNDKACRCGTFCSTSVYSTPRNPEGHARRLRQAVDHCVYAPKARREKEDQPP